MYMWRVAGSKYIKIHKRLIRTILLIHTNVVTFCTRKSSNGSKNLISLVIRITTIQ